jgi:hypothetical protein
MPFDPSSVVAMETIYNEGKFWLAFGGVMWSVFKAAKWIKDIKVIDLANIQTATATIRVEAKEQAHVLALEVKENSNAVVASLKEQTSAVVRELQELRQDFRAFCTPQTILPAYASPAPRKIQPRVRAAKAGK